MKRFLDRFDVILLDLNGTFMFGHDRFGPDADYHATYRSLGGTRLGRDAVVTAVQACCSAMLREYDRPARFDDYPSLPEALREYTAVEEEDCDILASVFEAHEIGRVPAAHAAWIRRTATTHKLGIVSNICGRPEPWRSYLNAEGLLGAFTYTLFSSDGRSIKPSARIFQRALAQFPADSRVLFVGDSLDRDIIPARALGLATVWLAPAPASHPAADMVVESLVDLDAVAA